MNRLNKGLALLEKINANSLILKNESNMHYFCNFSPSEGIILITKNGNGYHIVDSRYVETAKKFSKNNGLKVIENNSGHIEDIKAIIKKENLQSVAFENETISLKYYLYLKENLNVQFVELKNELAKIRNVKDDLELQNMIKAQRIAEKAFTEILNYIKIGKTEKELAAQFDYLMAQYGSDGVSFPTIFLSGKRTSMPHGVPSEKKIENGDFVLMDFGATFSGYHSDTTRTVAIGNATDEMIETYNLVLKSQKTAINEIKAGMPCKELFKIAHNVLEEKNKGKYFRHALGHGVGLDIHEIYTSSLKSNDIYEVGNITSIEPGVYIPDKFGVRIEDVVYIGENKVTNIVTLDKELKII